LTGSGDIFSIVLGIDSGKGSGSGKGIVFCVDSGNISRINDSDPKVIIVSSIIYIFIPLPF
jgi:hypothetical protein